MKTITKLSAAQEARFPEFVSKWIEIGLSTQPADRDRAERAIRGLYSLAKLKEPRIIWLPCPISAALSAAFYAKAIQHRLVSEPSKKASVYSAVYSAVGSAVRSAVYSAVDSAVDSAVGSAVEITDAIKSSQAIQRRATPSRLRDFGLGKDDRV